jgi:translation initiation factor IF-2
VIGQAEVRAIFKSSKLGKIAGCRVTEGEVRRNAEVRVLRNGKELHSGPISSLKHEKDDVKEVREGFECGINLKDFNEIQEGDILEAFVREMVAAA